LNQDSLFPNGEEAAFISLPKVVGSLSGGIVLFNSKKMHKNVYAIMRRNQMRNIELGQWQSRQKCLDVLGRRSDDFSTWLHYENQNTFISNSECFDIYSKMLRYFTNGQMLRNRSDYLESLVSTEKRDHSRVGPVVVFSRSTSEAIASKIDKLDVKPHNFLWRHFDFSRSGDCNPDYSKAAIAPIHAGISEKIFESLTRFLGDL